MRSMKKFVQPYRFSNRPYQSLPQMLLALILGAISLLGLVTLNGWVLIPGVLIVVVLELSAYPQEKHWQAKTNNE